MLECLILGDSIAVGIGQARPECVTLARSGITSEKWYRGYNNNPYFIDDLYKVVVISLGTNDFRGMTSEMLYSIREKIKSKIVVWIAPSSVLKPTQNQIVREIANEFKDKVLDISEYVGHDKIHPPTLDAYRKIAGLTKNPAAIKSNFR